MKNSNLKSILFSLLAVAVVTVFLSSCEKDVTQNNQEITKIETDENSIVYFKLPKSLDNMSPADFESYMADKDENHISELAEEIPQGDLALRGPELCSPPKYIGYHCSGSCPYPQLRGKVKFYRQYCQQEGGWIWWSENQPDCCD